MTVSKKDIAALIETHGLNACFDCGKCTASCPMSEVFADLTFARTPRGIIEKALLNADLVTGDAIWYCLSCVVCTEGCPTGVKIRNFIAGIRNLVLKEGRSEHGVYCRRCHKYFLPVRSQQMLQQRLAKQEDPLDFLRLCQPCKVREASEKIKKGLPKFVRRP